MKLKNFDHIVLTTGHLEECLHFYRDFLDMTVVFDKGRYALLFGNCKINIHQRPGEFQPAAAYPVSGSIDLCIITETPMEKVRSELLAKGAPVITDVVDRHGARGPMKSIYLRDPTAISSKSPGISGRRGKPCFLPTMMKLWWMNEFLERINH